MSAAKTVTGRIKLIERAGRSTMGNPTFALTVELSDIEGTPVETGSGVAWQSNMVRLITMSNSAVAYSIQNPEFRDVPVTFELTPAGRVRNAKPVKL